MKKLKTGLGIAVVALALVTFVSSAFAKQSDNQGGNIGRGANMQISSEDRDAINKAIETGDYNTWKSLEKNSAITEKINESNFARFAEMHKLMKQADDIREELGIEGMRGKGGMMRGAGMTDEQRANLDTAFANGDYNLWKQTVGENNPMLQKINESNFARFAEMHKLMKGGDVDGANTIAKELGIENGFGKRGGRRGGPSNQNSTVGNQSNT